MVRDIVNSIFWYISEHDFMISQIRFRYTVLTLKESSGVTDHSKKFCTPKNNVLETKGFIAI